MSTLPRTSNAPHRTSTAVQDIFYVIPRVISNVPHISNVVRYIFSALLLDISSVATWSPHNAFFEFGCGFRWQRCGTR